MSDAINTLIHDLRNPLNNIAMNAELGSLILHTDSYDKEKLEELFAVIVRQCRQCSVELERLKAAVDELAS
ncbi:histidine kinase dimerization/phospho-acceptor domain-containing protein [Exilibacterium tricleocarpae]|uniref:histidine kinase dimerization/phospho-acceptor domain-containing protein n=1 Tax=Exilibacterium tricleocarpae TaxID=2591008 RepID=UPI001FE38FCD|nr:histidine kinase dimerization/phospho-acceptor domain-containing protein [Exilibacterium tricleocarpae]